MSKIVAYTDGGCWPNPGNGGWGAVITGLGEDVIELHGGELNSTNNRMELQAAIEALKAIGPTRHPVTIFTDSQYVKKGASIWIHKWKRTGWKVSRKNPGGVKNRGRWQQIDALSKTIPNLRWEWVKGHSGVPGNERADELAQMGQLLAEPPADQTMGTTPTSTNPRKAAFALMEQFAALNDDEKDEFRIMLEALEINI